MSNVAGRRIAYRRQQLKMTQEDLAYAMDISQKQVSRYETGTNKPSAQVIIAFAKALDTTPNYLLGFTNNPMGGVDTLDLAPEEIELLLSFRSKDEISRQKIVEIVKMF